MSKKTINAYASNVGRDSLPASAVGIGKAIEGNLGDQLNTVNTTLAACQETLEAISARVGATPSGDEGMPPLDNTLVGAASYAERRANALLSRLRDLAATVGA